MMPRAASSSSTMRRLSGNRKYSQIAWLMISAGKRWPAYGERAGVAIPLGYPAHSATASPSARNLTVPLLEAALNQGAGSPGRNGSTVGIVNPIFGAHGSARNVGLLGRSLQPEGVQPIENGCGRADFPP